MDPARGCAFLRIDLVVAIALRTQQAEDTVKGHAAGMKTLCRSFLFIILLVGFSSTILEAQPATSGADRTVETSPTVPILPAQTPQKASESEIQNVQAPLWSYGEVNLSVAVLIFGVIFLFFLSWALCKLVEKPTAEDVLKCYTVGFVIIGVLFMVAAGWGSNQIAPAIGLFGTIVGYMLGRSARLGPSNSDGARESSEPTVKSKPTIGEG